MFYKYGDDDCEMVMEWLDIANQNYPHFLIRKISKSSFILDSDKPEVHIQIRNGMIANVTGAPEEGELCKLRIYKDLMNVSYVKFVLKKFIGANCEKALIMFPVKKLKLNFF